MLLHVHSKGDIGSPRGGGIDEVLKFLEQGGIVGGQAMATAARATDACAAVGILAGVGARVEFGEAAVDGRT